VVNASGSGVVPANGIQIAYETFGEPGGRPLIMVMGLGASIWPALVDAVSALADRAEGPR
jgi:pimeloyl-ACP methyl ester carboxylesterase